MNFWFGLLIGLKEISAHKFRSFLTMLGIILGVSSLLSMFALTEGLARGMREMMYATGGMERVEVSVKDPSEQCQNLAFLSPGRTMEDAIALRKGAPLVDLVSPELSMGMAITRSNKTLRLGVSGGEPEILEMGRFKVEFGRPITRADLDSVSRVVVVGPSVVSELWPESPGYIPLGEVIRLNGIPYRIVGVLQFEESSFSKRRREAGLDAARAAQQLKRLGKVDKRYDPLGQKNRAIVIPISTMFYDFRSASNPDLSPNRKLDRLCFRVADLALFEETINQVRTVLDRTHRGIDDFGFDTREEWADAIERNVSSSRTTGGLIAGISLLVGGIGITNIMLASITERIREIGVRRAIGARQRDIFIQIVVESGVIGFIGGILGLVVALGLVRILVMLSPAQNTAVITFPAVLISFGFAVGIGVISGLYPAWKASTLDPIEALRYG